MLASRSRLFNYITSVVSCLLLAGFLLMLAISFSSPDPTYQLVAVSWGSHTENDTLCHYQVQVIGTPSKTSGEIEVSARVCIDDGYFHDLGKLGTASSMCEAVQLYGDIQWLPDKITIGGHNGTAASLPRSQLQRHR